MPTTPRQINGKRSNTMQPLKNNFVQGYPRERHLRQRMGDQTSRSSRYNDSGESSWNPSTFRLHSIYCDNVRINSQDKVNMTAFEVFISNPLLAQHTIELQPSQPRK